MLVTIRHYSGQMEDVDAETARRLVRAGVAYLMSAPPVETAMVEPPEHAMLPRARARKPRTPRGGKGS